MAILIGLLGIVMIARMATDIFPSIDIPVVSVIWSYSGVAPEEMEKRFVTVCERAMTTTVNDIEHIESQSYNGVAVIKVYFHEGAKVEAGVAQITSICQTLLRIMPPGTTRLSSFSTAHRTSRFSSLASAARRSQNSSSMIWG
jgi:multidrug efflux pump subunit AcrB